MIHKYWLGFYLREHFNGPVRRLSDEEVVRLNNLRFQNRYSLSTEDRVFLDDVSMGLWEKYRIPGHIGGAVPLEYQADAYLRTARRFDKGDRSVAIFWEQGLGKTKLALMLLSYLANQSKTPIRRVLVTAPGGVARQWAEQELPKHYSMSVDKLATAGQDVPGTRKHLWRGGTTQKERKAFDMFLDGIEGIHDLFDGTYLNSGLHFFFVNIEAFSHKRILKWVKQFIDAGGPSAIIVDESSTIKNGYAKPKTSRAKRAGSSRANVLMDLASDFDYRMILSGTPTPQSPVDLWSQFEFLEPGFWNISRYSFYLHHTVTRTFNTGGRSVRNVIDRNTWYAIKRSGSPHEALCHRFGIDTPALNQIKNTEYDPYRDREGITNKIAPITLYGRVKHLFELPERRYIRVNCYMGKTQTEYYDNMLRDRMLDFKRVPITANNAAAATEKLLQITGGFIIDSQGNTGRIPSAKLAALKDLISGFDPDEPVLYWAYHREEQKVVYECLVEHFGREIVALNEGREDDSSVIGFKDDTFTHLVSGSSLAFGHNFQHSHTQVYFSNGWRGDIRDQQEARTHRIGQRHSCVYYDLVAMKGSKNLIDTHVLDVLKGKADLLDYFRGGLDSARA